MDSIRVLCSDGVARRCTLVLLLVAFDYVDVVAVWLVVFFMKLHSNYGLRQKWTAWNSVCVRRNVLGLTGPWVSISGLMSDIFMAIISTAYHCMCRLCSDERAWVCQWLSDLMHSSQDASIIFCGEWFSTGMTSVSNPLHSSNMQMRSAAEIITFCVSCVVVCFPLLSSLLSYRFFGFSVCTYDFEWWTRFDPF